MFKKGIDLVCCGVLVESTVYALDFHWVIGGLDEPLDGASDWGKLVSARSLKDDLDAWLNLVEESKSYLQNWFGEDQLIAFGRHDAHGELDQIFGFGSVESLHYYGITLLSRPEILGIPAIPERFCLVRPGEFSLQLKHALSVKETTVLDARHPGPIRETGTGGWEKEILIIPAPV